MDLIINNLRFIITRLRLFHFMPPPAWGSREFSNPSKNNMAAKLFKCLLLFILLILTFVVSTPMEKKRKCIVCHKNIEKKLGTTRSSLPQQHELEACFGVSCDEPGTLCSTCRRALYRYKKTGKRSLM